METVTCPSCSEENPAKFKLCGFCGTPLAPVPETVLCPSCKEENPSKFRLCGFCGTALAVPGTAAPGASAAGPIVATPAPTAALPPTEVRKFVTLVFTDLKDSTALTASIDAEAMNEIKARYFAAMAAEIERHGGHVEKNIGDAIMAVFGRIRASEDDALRGVRAAADMVSKLTELNEEFERYYGVRLTVRTGVNTGEVVASTDENATMNLATGDAVNVAARLEQNAPANEVLIGEMTHALVRNFVDAERVELTLKGKSEPVPAYRLLAVREQTAVPSQEDSPFVGREFEMDILNGAFAQVVESRSARLVVVVGDAGVGKTRLIADFIRRASDRATILRGRCLAYGDGITFWPLTEIVRAAARISEDDTTEAAKGKIASLLGDDPERDAIVERVSAAVGLSTASFQVGELSWGARKLLESQATKRPLLVVIDDIHWAEDTFLDFLEHLVGAVKDRSILLVCSARPDLLDDHAEWLDQPSVERIDLQPLGGADVEAMIDRLLGSADLPAETRERVIAAAEGNPLYIEQIVSMAREHGGGEFVVPPSIHALLAARLDNLTREERAIVEPACVIGLVFPEPAIEEMVPALLRPTVAGHLVDLDRKQFVHPLDTDDDPAFRFHHILVRDAAYQSLLKRARASLHERFVDWAEPVNRERGRETEFEEILGYHLEQAVRYRSELGPLDDLGRALATRAAIKLASAGRRAFARGDTPAASNLLRRAAALLGDDDPARIELVTELADALTEEGAFEEAATAVAEAAAGAERIGDRRLAALAMLEQRSLDLYVGETALIEQTVSDAREMISVFESVGDVAGRAKAWRLLMVIQGGTGAYDRAAEAAQQVVELASAAGDARLAARGAVGYAVTALHGATPVTEALKECEQLAREVSGDRKAEAVILGVLAQLHAMLGEFELGRDLYGRALGMLMDLGPSVTASSTSTESARVEILAGDLVGAERELRRDDAALAELGDRLYRSSVVALLAGVLEMRGELDEAELLSETAEELADEDDVASQVWWRQARARVYARRGRGPEAQALIRRATELASGTVDITLQADALSDLALVLRLTGSPDEAAPHLEEALALYERKGDLVSTRRVRAAMSELLEAGPPVA